MVMEKERLIAQKIKSVPLAPGVYIFKDQEQNILYIGKARCLRKRVASYFIRLLDRKTQALVEKIYDIDYILTPSEAQALIKEAALVKKYLPPYNTALRDDKSFPFICVSKEAFPRVFICRNPEKSLGVKIAGLRVFGPYTHAGLLRQALKAIRFIFPFCSCASRRKKSFLYYRLHLCPGPGLNKISREDYRENIKNMIMFLEGKDADLLKGLSRQMQEKAREKDFEAAAKIRDQIKALESIMPWKTYTLDLMGKARDLGKVLGMKKKIERIEAFDVSNVFGAQATAALVSFYKGEPDKNNYRRFRIKTVFGIDDYQMLREVIRRRYQRLIKEKLHLPDLIVIDGGRGQLNTAKNQLKALKVNIPVISIAKEKEEVYTLRRKTPLRLGPGSAALQTIQRIRDEAHRFAVAYHHVLRRKKIIGK